MSDDVLEVADKLWRGELSVTSLHPVGFQGALAEVRPGVAFIPSFANVSAFSTTDGLVFVDTGSSFVAKSIHEEIRKWSDSRLDTAVYSHGHIDHVFGVPVFEDEAAERGWEPPVVVAHEALPPRFDRYIRTAGYNAVINRRQFQVPGLQWPVDYRYPDRTYSDRLDLEVGGGRSPSTTQRARPTTTPGPGSKSTRRSAAATSSSGPRPTPAILRKVQRFPGEWAAALREMVELGPEILLPGHGFPVIGADRVRHSAHRHRRAPGVAARADPRSHEQGARLDEILHTVEAPRHLLERPYLRPVYDEPEFVVRNIWRLYGGWYDGDPSSLKPPTRRDLAFELASLAGGAGVLADRARALAEAAKKAHEAAAPEAAAPQEAFPHQEAFPRGALPPGAPDSRPPGGDGHAG